MGLFFVLTLLVLSLAGCGDSDGERPVDLDARRAALGLSGSPGMSFDEAMDEIDSSGYERRLSTGKLGLDDALRLENLLRRADLTGKPEEFVDYHQKTVAAASRHVRAMSDESGRVLLESCVDCHVTYRKR